jgi:nucleotide-binding universal stress UspA family protein
MTDVPQPAVARLTDFAAHPLVIGVVPGQPDLVPLTAWSLGGVMRAPALHFAYADPSRYVVREHPDGAVDHAPVDPDSADDGWRSVAEGLEGQVRAALPTSPSIPWHLHYLAGRPDRALTHLARAVDAAAIVVGTRAPGPAARLHELVEGSVAVHLSHHQHRPVITVPLSVVDWKDIRAPWPH